jgi:hypothetical protein
MKLENIVKAFETLTTLSTLDKEKNYNFKVATRLKVASNIRILRPFVQDYLSQKDALVKELGTEIKEKNQIVVTAENFPKFSAQNREMLDIDQNVSIVALKESELGDNQIPFEILADMQDSGLLKE